MRWLKQISAWVLLILWLPATLHCAVGSLTAEDAGSCNACAAVCHQDNGAAHEDACAVVESGDYTWSAVLAHLPPPRLTTLAWLACVHDRLLSGVTPLLPPTWTKDDPAGWVPRWAFAARAALPARAPNLA